MSGGHDGRKIKRAVRAVESRYADLGFVGTERSQAAKHGPAI